MQCLLCRTLLMSFTCISPPELKLVLSQVLDLNPSPQNWQKFMLIVGMNFPAAWTSIFYTTWPIRKLSKNQSWAASWALHATTQHSTTLTLKFLWMFNAKMALQMNLIFNGLVLVASGKGYFRANSSHLNNRLTLIWSDWLKVGIICSFSKNHHQTP